MLIVSYASYTQSESGYNNKHLLPSLTPLNFAWSPLVSIPCHAFAGTLPDSWGSQGAFPNLSYLGLYDLPLTGQLPAAWSGNNSFPSLSTLYLGGNSPGVSKLAGTLPAEWGSPTAFTQLESLTIANCSISGATV